MPEQLLRACKTASKSHELQRAYSSAKDQSHQSRKKQRKVEVLTGIPQDPRGEFRFSKSWVCKNSACRATLSADDTFCKRCSCCICHLFDDNKDPSLWLECSSESGAGESCGLSCHIDCALQHGKVGVVDVGLLTQLDGSYCCASCGRVSGIIGCWRKQLVVAKDARRIDALCHRIFLSHRLLFGTSRYSKLHEIITEAKSKLETEVGPLDGVSAKMARSIVSRLSVAVDVQRLCSLALARADELLASEDNISEKFSEGSLPAACKFVFEEVTSSSVVLLLIDPSTPLNEDIKGYKLWYCKTRDETYLKEPSCVFPRDQRRIWIYNLQPCTEYSFRIISYTDSGDFGHSEVKCFTKSVEIINKNHNSITEIPRKIHSSNLANTRQQQSMSADTESESSAFKVRDLGNMVKLLTGQGHFCADTKRLYCSHRVKQETREERPIPSVSRRLDLNISSSSLPDLNLEFTPTLDSSGDEEGNGHVHDSDSTLTHGSPLTESMGCLDESFDYCVKMIRWMECEGHISRDFRLKLLTWLSVGSTVRERKVVTTFIQSMIDDPVCLAEQLVDTVTDIMSSSKRTHRNVV